MKRIILTIALTADHGVDPNVDHTDHTREYAPLLVYGPRARAGGGKLRAGSCELRAA